MALLTKDRDTRRRAGYDFHRPVAGGARIFAGSVCCLNAGGYAVPATAAEGLKFPALATQTMDNREGQNGDLWVHTERTVVGLDMDSSGNITPALIGSMVYLLDDHTVAAAGAGRSPAGMLVDIRDGQAWVDLTRA